MFRILVVDDDTDTSDQLKKLISAEIEGSQVDTAETVVEGQRLIAEARLAKRPYQAIVLDLMLPANHPGDNPEVHEALCRDIRDIMPDALLAHITAYKGDKQVSTHLQEAHDKQPGNRNFRLWKLEGDFAEQLVGKLKPFLYGLSIGEQMKKIFDLGEPPAYSYGQRGRFPNTDVGRGSLTHEIAALSRDICAHWRDLDESTRADVREVFNVIPDGSGGVVVSLFKT
jgi:CheY-like chemotaxis protein